MKYMTEKEFDVIKKRIAKGDSRATSDLYLNFRDFMFSKVYKYVETKSSLMWLPKMIWQI